MEDNKLSVDMYAASHCKAKYHAQGLIRDGEFLTQVWFLMVKMGLGQQYNNVSDGLLSWNHLALASDMHGHGVDT